MHTIFDIAAGKPLAMLSKALWEEQVANEGFRGYWYPLTSSQYVGAAPVAFDRMGERIVLWRDADGVAHAQEDRCPHRGARLSQRRVHGNEVVCPYDRLSL